MTDTSPSSPSISRAAWLAGRVAVAAVILIALGATAAHYGWLPPYPGFLLFGLGLIVGGALALVLGLVGLVKTRGGRLDGRASALFGTVAGVALLAGLAVLLSPNRGAPPIHDITTDPQDPPVFREIAKLPDNEGRDLTYPHGGAGVTDEQRGAYPDLAPITLALAPGEAFDAAQRAIDELGWTVVWSNRVLGVIEAYEVSSVFRFADDVAVRIRETPDGSVIDLRSTSRVGVSDLGANARRIRAFAEAIQR